jgi:hypothetical protein
MEAARSPNGAEMRIYREKRMDGIRRDVLVLLSSCRREEIPPLDVLAGCVDDGRDSPIRS